MGLYWWYHNTWFMHRVYHEHWNPHWHPGDREWVHNNVNVYSRWPRNTVVTRAYFQRPAGTAQPAPAASSVVAISTRAGTARSISIARKAGINRTIPGAWRRIDAQPADRAAAPVAVARSSAARGIPGSRTSSRCSAYCGPASHGSVAARWCSGPSSLIPAAYFYE